MNQKSSLIQILKSVQRVLTSDTLTVIIATPMDERNEAIRDVVFSAFAGFLLLGILVAFVAYRSVKRSVSVIADLSTEIEAKDAQNLTPINRQNTFA